MRLVIDAVQVLDKYRQGIFHPVYHPAMPSIPSLIANTTTLLTAT